MRFADPFGPIKSTLDIFNSEEDNVLGDPPEVIGKTAQYIDTVGYKRCGADDDTTPVEQ